MILYVENPKDSMKTYGYQGGRVGGKDRLGVWDWHIHIDIFKIDNQQGTTV